MKVHAMIRIAPQLAALSVLAAASAAHAHVVLRPADAPPGSDTALHFVVGHGCKDQPTTALRIELPAGVELVSAEPKPGWTVSVDKGAATAVSWRGELPPHQPGDFEVRAKLPRAPLRMFFVAVQSCGDQTVRWDQPYASDGPRPERAAPVLTLATDATTATTAAPAGGLPPGVQRLNGAFADAAGRPLYTFNFDTMVGMSHCEGDCAQMWPPLIAPKDARPFGDWSLVKREDGSLQWAYRTKPLYTYSKDRPGGPPTGLAAPNWTLAK
jgi:predicted lipoprotein with Yx(FWY)xxD motif